MMCFACRLAVALIALAAIALAAGKPPLAVVIVSANAEWRVVRSELRLDARRLGRTPYGEFAELQLGGHNAVILQGGWGKVDAAASAQYAIGRWRPHAVLNLGTCGGMDGVIARHEVVLADRTVIYDIVERMGDPAEAIRAYATPIDLNWLGTKHLPIPVRRATLVSADGDLDANDIPRLQKLYGAVAADWESGAIARVAARNGIARVLVLRGVSDLVKAGGGGEAYGNMGVFEQGTAAVMKKLLASLPAWLALAAQPE